MRPNRGPFSLVPSPDSGERLENWQAPEEALWQLYRTRESPWDPLTALNQAHLPAQAPLSEAPFAAFQFPSFIEEGIGRVSNVLDSRPSTSLEGPPDGWNSDDKDVSVPYVFEFESVPKSSPGLSTPASSKHSSPASQWPSVPGDASFEGDFPRTQPQASWKVQQVCPSTPDGMSSTPESVGSRPKRSSRDLENEQQPTESKSKRSSIKSLNDLISAGRVAKLPHNVVERNYRDRLNDQITELSSYLFDLSGQSNLRLRPPKCLVISRAKERLVELTSHNAELLGQIEELKQRIAILDHIISPVSSNSNDRHGGATNIQSQ